MSHAFSLVEHRSGQRFDVSLPVRAEWDEADTERHVFTEGNTKNVGPHGALIHLQELPSVGSRVHLAIMDPEAGPRIEVLARVLRLERNPTYSFAAMDLLEAEEKWRSTIWEVASRGSHIQAVEPTPGNPSEGDPPRPTHPKVIRPRTNHPLPWAILTRGCGETFHRGPLAEPTFGPK